MQMDEGMLSFSVALFAALAHPTRLRMVELLTEGEKTVSEVAHTLGVLQPNASQHLAALQRAGVVTVDRVGAMRRYSLRGPRIPRILALVEEFQQKHAADFARSKENEKQ